MGDENHGTDRSTKKPLRILTFNSVGITGLSMLMIVDELMDAIAANPDNTGGKPLPCEVFDVIGGIGVGGWIALLLGRLHLDIPTCIRAYVEIINAVSARSWMEKRRLRWNNANFNQTRLLSKVTEIVERYSKGTGDKMLYEDKEWPRCQFAFAAASVKSARPHREYQIFRTYRTPDEPISEGPDAATCHIADAFAATAASKYLFNSFRPEHSSVQLFDSDSLDPHAITLLAMEEVSLLTPNPHPIQLAINIGSGASTRRDYHSLAGLFRIFSFGTPLERMGTLLRDTIADHRAQTTEKTTTSKLEFVELLNTARTDPASGMPHRKKAPRDDKLTEMAISRESKYREDINGALEKYYIAHHSHCPELRPKYIPLGPEVAPRNTVVNDVAAAQTTFTATCAYIKRLRPQMDEKAAPLCCSG
ncbi:hypothetical protein A1O1_01795 [Capronia coronata CBS 617.96]|uniref:PNPLA domain-containing protein n=1 Tax=Capronia coronata CBS 617.96 TaxID=1182541 RepID=W9YLJ0_9EURO|nr:uncharacterized protein A1O1_01795 [Capronia coronata CBS 617.96]EXJ93403.1 hypothetical protein A1O1_01795 [Capronia coronata CBS 617.96]